jgi:DNA-binding ferritin-like protein
MTMLQTHIQPVPLRIAHSFDPHLGRRVTRKVKAGPVDKIGMLSDCLAHCLDLESRLRMLVWQPKGRKTAGMQKQCRKLNSELASLADRLGSRVRGLGGAGSASPQDIARRSTLRKPSTRKTVPTIAAQLASLDRDYAQVRSMVRQAFDHLVSMDDLRSTEILFDAMALLDRQRSQISALVPNLA